VSVYTFQCRRLKKFIHKRIIFAGDSAHQVSPFGARGANGGVQDVDNLIWKLKLVMDQKAPDSLLESYNYERILAADENILNSTRSTEFITPKNKASKIFRDAVLSLSKKVEGIRPFINSGRLSMPAIYADSPLNSPDFDEFKGDAQVGSPCIDAPIQKSGGKTWLLKILGRKYCGLYFCGNHDNLNKTTFKHLNKLTTAEIPLHIIIVANNVTFKQNKNGFTYIIDSEKKVKERYDGKSGTFYLIRPDQHIAARWKSFNLEKVQNAIRKSIGYSDSGIKTVKKTYKPVINLVSKPNLKNPDNIYQKLIENQNNLDDAELNTFQAKLILLLMNHVGNEQVLEQAIKQAKEGTVKKIKTNS
jgi:3-(3-hydroxy-phenyl)propionate hydroxylase